MAAVAQAERRRQLQEYLAAKRRPKCPGAQPYLKDQTNHPDPPFEAVSEAEHLDRKKDAPPNVVKGTCRDGKLAANPPRPAGHAAPLKSSNASQRAAVVRAQQLGKGPKLPTGTAGSTKPSAQPRGRLPAAASAFPNTGGQEGAGGGQSPHRAPCSLQERLGKENLPAQAAAEPVPSNTSQSDGNNPGNKRALAHEQSSGTVSRTARGPEDRGTGRQTKEALTQNKFRKPLPGSKSASQKPSGTARPSQPPQSVAGSVNPLPKKPAVRHEKTNAGREPQGKLLGTLLGGSLKHSSRAPQVKRSPTKPPASSRPRFVVPMRTPALKLGPTGQWQRPPVRGGADRRDVKTAPPGHTAASQVRVPRKQPPPSTYSSKTPALQGEVGSRKERCKPELPQTHGVHAGRVPKTPTPADRKRQLEQWLASKGKSYKRPPMMLPPKKPLKGKLPLQSTVKEEQEPEKPEQLHQDKINSLLTECLQLIEEGVPSEELPAALSREPAAEKCAKFWICRARLLARRGPFDVTELYDAAVRAGAAPLQELKEVVLDILKTAEQPSGGEKPEQPVPWEPVTPHPGERQHAAVTPCPTESCPGSLPVSSIKLQVKSIPRVRELTKGHELKVLTPVRRSLRIEGAGSRYPQMLRDHDPVVSSLSEILDDEEETQFLFRKNKALPKAAVEVLRL